MNVQPHLLTVSAYIDQNLDKDLPLSALAKRVGLSPFHFHRKFGAYFGESLHQHIKRLRLERAAFALKHGSLPVRQIARHSGYKTVSAFSHAFSGFAGESPTRYRTQATSIDGSGPATESATLEPDWVGDLPSRDFAFVRSSVASHDAKRSVGEALALIGRLVGGRAGDSGDVDSRRSDGDFECIVATSDVHGFFQDAGFRIDVGVDADVLPEDRGGVLGRQTLPGGRYARYAFRCAAEEVVAHCRRVSLKALQAQGETPRLSQYFVRFAPERQADDRQPGEYRLHVPLVG